MKYLKFILSLFPEGIIWNRNKGSFLYNLSLGMSPEFERIGNAISEIKKEINPKGATYLIDEWVDFVGKDNCGAHPLNTIQEKRDYASSKINSFLPDLSLKTIQGYLSDQGIDASVKPYSPFTCNSSCEDSLSNAPGWANAYAIRLSSVKSNYFKVNSKCSGALRTFDLGAISCVLRTIKQSHQRVIITGEING